MSNQLSIAEYYVSFPALTGQDKKISGLPAGSVETVTGITDSKLSGNLNSVKR